jgi:hypothetical protein
MARRKAERPAERGAPNSGFLHHERSETGHEQ